jgi:hypothetical protein
MRRTTTQQAEMFLAGGEGGTAFPSSLAADMAAITISLRLSSILIPHSNDKNNGWHPAVAGLIGQRHFQDSRGLRYYKEARDCHLAAGA